MTQSSRRFAIVTISYAPDFERCQLLAASTERCLPDDIKHYIIVDRKDLKLFSQLQSSKIEILVVEDIIPWWIFRVPFFSKGWISLRTLPIRNWILQQLVKMSACNVIDENVLVFCDSDVTFTRPFDITKTFLDEQDRVALLRVDFQNADVESWIHAAQQILDIEQKDIPVFNYVGNLITWRKENVLKMHRHIEEVNQMHWICAICKHWNISEYMIYGMMVDHVLGADTAGHFIAAPELIKASWSDDLDDDSAINRFFEEVQPQHVGVMLHSKDQIPIEAYRHKVEQLWQQNC